MKAGRHRFHAICGRTLTSGREINMAAGIVKAVRRRMLPTTPRMSRGWRTVNPARRRIPRKLRTRRTSSITGGLAATSLVQSVRLVSQLRDACPRRLGASIWAAYAIFPCHHQSSDGSTFR